jgi:hypothetical protein
MKTIITVIAATCLSAGAAFAAPAPTKPAMPSYIAEAAAHAKTAAKPAAKTAAKPGVKRAVRPGARNMNDRTPTAKAAKAKPGATFKPAGGKVIKKYVGPLKKLPRRTPAKKP